MPGALEECVICPKNITQAVLERLPAQTCA